MMVTIVSVHLVRKDQMQTIRHKSTSKRYDHNTNEPIFDIVMVFENPKHFKDVVIKYVAVVRRDIKFTKNGSKRVRAICKATGCKWMIFASYERNNENFIVKRYKRNHKYNWTFDKGLHQKYYLSTL